jgi:hypothetical protein
LGGRYEKNALLIGNENYYGAISKITAAKNDLKVMEHKLSQIKFDLIIQSDLKKQEILDNIKTFINAAECDSINIIYFSGHGFQYQGTNYIVPIDFIVSDARNSGCSLDEIISFTISKQAQFIFIVDACRDNIDSSLSLNYSDMKGYPNVFIAFATQFNLTASYTPNDVSFFTKAICNNILIPNIAIQELFLRIRTELFNTKGSQLSNTIDCLLKPLVLNEIICTDKTDEKIYDFVEQYGERYNEKHGYFAGEIELFIDASQIFDIGILDIMYRYTKVSSKKYSQKILDEDVHKWIDLKYLISMGLKEIRYNWYFKGRRVRMGEIPLLPLSMEKPLPVPGKEIQVQFDVKLKQNEVQVKTTLPDGYILSLSIENLVYSMSETVENNKCTFNLDNSAIKDAIYKVILTSPIINVMPKLDKSVVGESARNLVGEFVEFDEIYGNTINYSREVLGE